MHIVHKPFLLWLLYIAVVMFAAAALLLVGIPQLAISADHSHLTVLLLVLYLVAEAVSARQAWLLSDEHRVTLAARSWLDLHGLSRVSETNDGPLTLNDAQQARLELPDSMLRNHIVALLGKASAGNRPIDQRLLLEASTEPLYARADLGAFLAARIVWVGILATIVGVIMAFWPLMQAGLDVDAMKTHLQAFFGGVAVAFIPTAASFVFKIALDFNARILHGACDEIVTALTLLSETHVLPVLAAPAPGPSA